MNTTVRMAAPNASAGSILLVEDDEPLARAYSRLLSGQGYAVVTASSVNEAIEHVMKGGFDVVISDVNLPGGSGVDVISVVRAYRPGVPIILLSGAPTLDNAMDAINIGVLEFLVKPVAREKLFDVVGRAMARRLSDAADQAADQAAADVAAAGAPATKATDEASPATQTFAPPNGPMQSAANDTEPPVSRASGMASHAVDLEPIYDARARRVMGFEARLIETEPALVMQGRRGALADGEPDVEMLRRCRALAANAFAALPRASLLFVDIGPSDLLDPELYSPEAPLSLRAEDVVLQLRGTGPAIANLHARVSVLRFLGFRIAVADVDGAASRLVKIAELAPEFVKLGGALLRGVESSSSHRRFVAGLVATCHAVGATPIAESVLSASQREALLDAGCTLLQGPLHVGTSPSNRPPVSVPAASGCRKINRIPPALGGVSVIGHPERSAPGRRVTKMSHR